MKREFIYIDGTVGAGKSTLMDIFTTSGYVPFPEPVVDNPLLDKFYYDKKKYAFELQKFFLKTRFSHVESTKGHEKVVLDRSIYCDEIFAKMLTDNGDMTMDEFETYQLLLNNMLEKCERPSLMIYLQISVEEAMRRITKRGRDYEQIVDRKYWEDLNHRYQEYFHTYTHSPLLVIDVSNLDFENSLEDMGIIVSTINRKLVELGHKQIKI